jgi:NFU1 iron-sulfur cluster scaffold homolog, mitochondrial
VSIEAQRTPNPDAIKLLCGRHISAQPRTFLKGQSCQDSELAANLLSLEGIEIVFFGEDFITVTKSAKENWAELQADVIALIDKHFASSNAAALSEPPSKESQIALTEIEKEILEVLDQYIRPAIELDGGNLIYRSFKEGIVRISLVGACQGCPSSAMTLKNGVQNTLQYYVPEVIAVELEE